ncbi:MAG: AbgT family transporter, partial [Spirochaetales bacterium]|nr:AbgT family transporter [Spirochaetales bacterium]
EKRKKRGLFWFAGWIGIMLVLILSSSFFPVISQYVLPIVVLCFLFGGIGAGFFSGMSGKWLGKSFVKGILGVAPGIILVLMASSITHILRRAEILDSILFLASRSITEMGPIGAGISVFLLVMMLNFFISSGSAKAFLIIPIIAPLADLTGLSRQTAVLAYVFGDGFSNVLYPSNALLLICLAITGIGFGKWFMWIWKIEALVFLLCILFIILAVIIGY